MRSTCTALGLTFSCALPAYLPAFFRKDLAELSRELAIALEATQITYDTRYLKSVTVRVIRCIYGRGLARNAMNVKLAAPTAKFTLNWVQWNVNQLFKITIMVYKHLLGSVISQTNMEHAVKRTCTFM